jgi:hypothetical protein
MCRVLVHLLFYPVHRDGRSVSIALNVLSHPVQAMI